MAAIRSEEIIVSEHPRLRLLEGEGPAEERHWHPSMGPDDRHGRLKQQPQTPRPRPNFFLRRLMVGLVGVIVLSLATGVAASAFTQAETSRGPVESYVVQPGDTLWSISVEKRPGADPRKTVSQIRTINHVGPEISPGQVITLP